MNFLFFDIECCNNLNLCSFGYVLADKQLNILEKKDIIINPDVDKIIRQHSKVPKLAYAYKDFMQAETFPHNYSRIAGLLQDENNIVCGFSACNDALFLNHATDRYSLPRIKFKFYDCQRMYGILFNYQKQIGLESLANIYEIDVGTSHKSDDDALTSCAIISAMCKELVLDAEGLIQMEPTSYVFNSDIGLELSPEWQASRAVKLGESLKGVNYKIFSKVIAEQNVTPCKNAINGVINMMFSFGRSFEKNNYKKAVVLIKKIAEAGGRYTTKVTRAQYFLNYDSTGERYQYASANPKTIKILDYEALIALLGINEQQMQDEICALDLKSYLDEGDEKFVL